MNESAIPEVKKTVDKKPAAKAKPAVKPEGINYDKLADMVASRMAPLFMNAAPKELQTDGMKTDDVKPVILGDGTLATGGNVVEGITDPVNKGYLSELSFMEEILEVVVHGTTDKNAENPVRVGVNGVEEIFFRDQPKRTRRKFVNALIVKQNEVTTPKARNGANEDTYGIRQVANAKFPFAIRHDPSPYGAQWLQQRMAETF